MISACLLVYLAPEKNMWDFASHSSVWNSHLLWPGKIVAKAAWVLVFPPFGTLVPAQMCLGFPPSLRDERPEGDLPGENFSTSPSKGATTLTFGHCVYLIFFIFPHQALWEGGLLIVMSVATRSKAWLGETLNRYEARLVIRMLWALLRLSYNISIKKWQGLKDHKWQKKQPCVASVRVGVSLCDSYPGSM